MLYRPGISGWLRSRLLNLSIALLPDVCTVFVLLVVLCRDNVGIAVNTSLESTPVCTDSSFSTSISPSSAAARLEVIHSAGTPFFLFASVSSSALLRNKVALRSFISASFLPNSFAFASL